MALTPPQRTAHSFPPRSLLSKATFRIFSEPWWRKHGGGENITMRCDPAADRASCGSVLQYMPKGWGNRASAVALLYNLPNYSLPLKAPGGCGLEGPGSGNRMRRQSPSRVASTSGVRACIVYTEVAVLQPGGGGRCESVCSRGRHSVRD
jgi:hypothetical protein